MACLLESADYGQLRTECLDSEVNTWRSLLFLLNPVDQNTYVVAAAQREQRRAAFDGHESETQAPVRYDTGV